MPVQTSGLLGDFLNFSGWLAIRITAPYWRPHRTVKNGDRASEPRKPSEQLRRRNAPEQWTSLAAAGCDLAAPKWPLGKPSKAEADLWAARLWGRAG
jgi:hypothetical protein